MTGTTIVSILFTDVVGFTSLRARRKDTAAQQIMCYITLALGRRSSSMQGKKPRSA